MDNHDDRMGPREYAVFDRVFMVFGSLCKSFAPGFGAEEWEKTADAMWLWSIRKVEELVETLYAAHGNGQPIKSEPAPEPEKVATVTDGQARRFYAIARGAGYTDDGIKRLLLHHSLDSGWQIPKNLYTRLCSLAEDKKVAAKYNTTPTESMPR
jgi:hypothetical protein